MNDESASKGLNRSLAWLSHFPFTLITLGILIFITLITNTQVNNLSRFWLNRLGFAPRDLIHLHWGRIITSALVTNGGRAFWEALIIIALAVGLSEYQCGTFRAAVTYWGVHFTTLLLVTYLVAVPLRLSGLSIGNALTVARDVGPSAAYFGCLGLVSAKLNSPWRWIFGFLVLGGLVVYPFLPSQTDENVVLNLSANMAHLIAYPLGWIAYYLWKCVQNKTPVGPQNKQTRNLWPHFE
jgi:hypothetical protein